MSGPTLAAFLELARSRQGHFRLDSGHHARLWLDLDALFAEPGASAPFVGSLTHELQQYAVDAVCGPLLGGAFLAQLIAQNLGTTFCFTEPHASASGGLYGTRYRLPRAYQRRLRGSRVAVVDDVVSAGSAIRGTHAALEAAGATPVVAGTLLVLGHVAADWLVQQQLPLVAVLREPYEMWSPERCPLCAAGEPIDDRAPPVG